MKELSTADLLGGADTDRLAGVVVSLLEEVIALSERVARLEGDDDREAAQARIDRLVERVLGPLA